MDIQINDPQQVIAVCENCTSCVNKLTSSLTELDNYIGKLNNAWNSSGEDKTKYLDNFKKQVQATYYLIDAVQKTSNTLKFYAETAQSISQKGTDSDPVNLTGGGNGTGGGGTGGGTGSGTGGGTGGTSTFTYKDVPGINVELKNVNVPNRGYTNAYDAMNHTNQVRLNTKYVNNEGNCTIMGVSVINPDGSRTTIHDKSVQELADAGYSQDTMVLEIANQGVPVAWVPLDEFIKGQ